MERLLIKKEKKTAIKGSDKKKEISAWGFCWGWRVGIIIFFIFYFFIFYVIKQCIATLNL
jgi:hypothetical protein